METFAVAWTIVWMLALWLPTIPGLSARLLKWGFPAIGLGLLFFFRDLPPAARLGASSLLFLYVMKAAVLACHPPLRLRWSDRLLYMTVWPGMDPENLVKRSQPRTEAAAVFTRGLVLTLVGVASVGLLALGTPFLSATVVGWIGIASLILTVHFGISGLLTSILWLSGRPVRPLFHQPLASVSPSDFWSRRWNLPFVDMDRRLFLPAIQKVLPLRYAVVAVFLVSGLLHEMAISYPAGGGWGGPMLYFLIQGLGVLGERKLTRRSRALTWVCVLLPLPLLFHEPFRANLIVPLFEWLHRVIAAHSVRWYVEAILWSLAPMQLSVLMASYQVPKKLNWYEELPRLSPFNRKLMWTYAIFIVATVIGFAIMTLVLHGSFMHGETAAIGLACFMSGFWILRLCFDTFYYRSEDWPAGVEFQIGHSLLNALFTYLVLGYGTVAVWGALLAPR